MKQNVSWDDIHHQHTTIITAAAITVTHPDTSPATRSSTSFPTVMTSPSVPGSLQVTTASIIKVIPDSPASLVPRDGSKTSRARQQCLALAAQHSLPPHNEY